MIPFPRSGDRLVIFPTTGDTVTGPIAEMKCHRSIVSMRDGYGRLADLSMAGSLSQIALLFRNVK
jgi:hypothetical protein